MTYEIIEQQIQEKMKAANVTGAALAIVRGNQIVLQKGFGVTSTEDSALPVTSDTLFCIGSVSKSLTGTLLLKLVEERKVNLDTPIVEYIPWFRLSNQEWSQKVTLRMLLSHTAGLPHLFEKYGSKEPEALEKFIRSLHKESFLFEPGATWSYSDVGIDTAGHLAQVVTGKYFHELMDEYVFQPLGMTRSTFDASVAITYPLALAHEQKDGVISVIHKFLGNAAQNPSSFAMTTVRDMASFMRIYLNQGIYEEVPYLKADSIDTMQTIHGDYFLPNHSGYGLSFEIDTYKGIKRLWHDGMVQSYGSWMYMAPQQQLGVVFLTNKVQGFWNDAEEIIQSIFDQEIGLKEETTTPIFEGETIDLRRCIGTYVGAWNGVVRIFETEGNLCLEKNGNHFVLQPFGRDRFFSEDLSVGFINVQDGEPIRDIMVDGIPCEKVSQNPQYVYNIEDLTPYLGSYSGGNDGLKFHVVDGQLYCYDNYDEKDYPCTILGKTRIAIPNCVVDFIQDEDGSFTSVRINKGKILMRGE